MIVICCALAAPWFGLAIGAFYITHTIYKLHSFIVFLATASGLVLNVYLLLLLLKKLPSAVVGIMGVIEFLAFFAVLAPFERIKEPLDWGWFIMVGIVGAAITFFAFRAIAERAKDDTGSVATSPRVR